MPQTKFALSLFFIAALLSSILYVADLPMLQFVCRAIAFPCIAFYYFAQAKRPYPLLAIAYLLVVYVGEVMINMEVVYGSNTLMIVFLISYVLLAISFLKSAIRLGFQMHAFIYATLATGLMAIILYHLVQFLPMSFPEEKIVVFSYCIGMLVLIALSMYQFVINQTSVGFYVAMVTMLNIITDIFLVVYALMADFKEFGAMVVLMLQISYYFAVKYFVAIQVVQSEENSVYES